MTRTYAHGGARALVYLHAKHLRAFIATWRQAAATGLELPASEDPDCVSLEAMLRHVLGAARGYMVWMCEVLELEDPAIDSVPDEVTADLDAYVAHVLERWDGPLCGLQARDADRPAYPSRWGTEYCIDAMLEHAAMHPIRHELQLDRLMGAVS